MKSLSRENAQRDSGGIALPSAPAKPSTSELAETSRPTTAKESVVKVEQVSNKAAPSTVRANDSLKQLEQELSTNVEKPKSSRQTAPRPVTNRPAASSADLEQKLEIAESQVSILTRELTTMRRSLQSSERRVEELVRINREGSSLGGGREYDGRGSYSDDESGALGDNRLYKGHTVPIANPNTPASVADGQPSSSEVATIISRRAALRTGPNKFESALMMMPRETVVNIELRSGNWYRVITAGGNRGWVAGEALEFQIGTSPDSAVRVGPVRMAYEPTGVRY